MRLRIQFKMLTQVGKKSVSWDLARICFAKLSCLMRGDGRGVKQHKAVSKESLWELLSCLPGSALPLWACDPFVLALGVLCYRNVWHTMCDFLFASTKLIVLGSDLNFSWMSRLSRICRIFILCTSSETVNICTVIHNELCDLWALVL